MTSKKAKQISTHTLKLLALVAKSIRQELGSGKIQDHDTQMIIDVLLVNMGCIIHEISTFEPKENAQFAVKKQFELLTNKLPSSFGKRKSSSESEDSDEKSYEDLLEEFEQMSEDEEEEEDEDEYIQ